MQLDQLIPVLKTEGISMSAKTLISSEMRQTVRQTVQKTVRRFGLRLRGAGACLLALSVAAQTARADTITYQQLRQDQSGRAATVASVPNVARTKDPSQGQNQQGQTGQTDPQGQKPVTAQEGTEHPEFVRLPDGRIVRYGPGIICDENCVEPIAPAAFRGPGPAFWWIVPPIIAGGILCIVLCRPDHNGNPQPSPTIVIPTPQPTASVSPTVAPSIAPSPTVQPTPNVPEPGTLILFGAGLGALLARRRRARKQQA
jgi:hypothetical protein